MTNDSDTRRPPLSIRPDDAAAEALASAMRATGGALSAHRVALAALTIGARAITARPSLVFGTEAPDPERTVSASVAAAAAMAQAKREAAAVDARAQEEAMAAALTRATRAVMAAVGAGHSREAIASKMGTKGGHLRQIIGDLAVARAPTGAGVDRLDAIARAAEELAAGSAVTAPTGAPSDALTRAREAVKAAVGAGHSREAIAVRAGGARRGTVREIVGALAAGGAPSSTGAEHLDAITRAAEDLVAGASDPPDALTLARRAVRSALNLGHTRKEIAERSGATGRHALDAVGELAAGRGDGITPDRLDAITRAALELAPDPH